MPDILPNQNNSSLYSDIDEVMSAPNSRIVKYGNAVLLGVLLIMFTISFFLRFNDGINEPVIVKSLTDVLVKSPESSLIIRKVLVQDGAKVQEGDTLIVASNGLKTIIITAPLTGSILLQRKLIVGDMLPPLLPLLMLLSEQERYSIKIIVSTINSQKITIGQRGVITLNKHAKGQAGQLNIEIISLPYKDINRDILVADAVFIPMEKGNLYKKLPHLIDVTGIAYIVTDNKRLLSKFIKF